ncbi:MAG: DUF1599 domain-containing protein [Williamsia sp.]|nr:DUF1599 domain-containing protein [Williamsia sp.]
MTTTTNQQYDQAVSTCSDIFLKKTVDYGTSWRVLRTISVVDQIYIKAKRIRTIQENGNRAVADDISSEFKGIVNYSIIGIIQCSLPTSEAEDLPVEQVASLYSTVVADARQLMQSKNHDYGEAWRDMSQESYTDLILSKLLRIRQILANSGRTLISEGIEANYYDIINYALFALIMIGEGRHLS